MPIAPPADWSPASWTRKEVLQQPAYPDEAALQDVLDRLGTLPPLVTSWEVLRLKDELAEAAHGRRFLLQGGDCAESFDECEAPVITNRMKVLMQMSLVLTYGLRRRVIRVGRFAGQYAKPRSSDVETRGGLTLPCYRGDIINDVDFTPEARTPDPQRLFRAYSHAAMSLNFVRALAEGGFADLHHPEYWDLSFVKDERLAGEYYAAVEALRDGINFMETINDAPLRGLERVEFFTSHEALHLPYEQALTRTVPHAKGYYNLSTHFPWVGMRTAQLDGAHIEYIRGLTNPIGVKVGAGVTAEQLQRLIDVLDPRGEPGRLTLIHRFGVDVIERHLPPLLRAARATGKTVLWVCDPMHGNTETTESGIKTRRFENILSELEQAFDLHAAEGSHLGGVHFELTGEAVTECLGGASRLEEADLAYAYRSRVDPRLNYNQALEMALLIVRKHRQMKPLLEPSR